VNFTREPIIETVITPREGCKLVVRSSKGNGQEDYYVDAVEVVSFGHSFFFRSLEKPKSFLVPVSDYEILELRETRMVLKNVPAERSIKIGGGREAPPRQQQYREPRESHNAPTEETREEAVEEESQPASAESASSEQRVEGGRKRERRRRGRRGGRDRNQEMRGDQQPRQQQPQTEPTSPTEGTELNEEQEPAFAPESEESKAAPSFISKLFPPPPTLIKETLGRYKTMESIEEDIFPETAPGPKEVEEQQKASPDETLFEHPSPPDHPGDEHKFEE
jgi:hypothetical protein